MALRTLAEREPATAAPTERLLHRGRQARRGRAALLGTAALSAVAVTAAAVAGFGSFGGAPPGGDPVPVAGPKVRLAAAAQATARTSFTFTVTTQTKTVVSGRPSSGRRHYEGAYDPAVPAGYLREPDDPRFESRTVGDGCYLRKLTRWAKKACYPSSGAYVYIGDVDLTSSAEPVQRLAELAELGTVTDLGVSGTGGAAVRRYAFEFTVEEKGGDLPDRIPVTGTVEVGVDSGKIARVVHRVKYDGTGTSALSMDRTVTWEYANYGDPVRVAVPAGAVPDPTGPAPSPSAGG
ncbi:hypothetical protein Cci01nite_81230 [Catellatospora citrea]|uniref:Uncharacterized protein n=2 Tax=Catellatospora citrea TaxID=53366 RepID=A0A8J3KXJ0_9ACTN|nr:hypothetical protein Cci01nite_81230 [Catellatospora citrea]